MLLLLLGTATGVLLVVVAASFGARHRARTHLHRWVSPYAAQATAMRTVTRTEISEFRPAAGLVDLRAVPTAASGSNALFSTTEGWIQNGVGGQISA